MQFGAHLPKLAFNHGPYSLEKLMEYTQAAEDLGFGAIAVTDHMVSSRPQLDGPTVLAAVLSRTRSMELVTSVALPVVRGPVPLAKSLSTIDILSGGRLIVGLGPGSSNRDYSAVGLNFEERWNRLDEAVPTLRALWVKDSPPFIGRFYSTEGIELEPHPVSPNGPPIWIGSWGSKAGLRRVARLGDGWLASAYNTTPQLFADGWRKLREG